MEDQTKEVKVEYLQTPKKARVTEGEGEYVGMKWIFALQRERDALLCFLNRCGVMGRTLTSLLVFPTTRAEWETGTTPSCRTSMQRLRRRSRAVVRTLSLPVWIGDGSDV